ncbi:anthranilate synthase [Bacillus sp. FJAT-27264]|uniref:anthranilate synthase component I family protein n=1 Tax=Paenibacillus sp. (strain DSM 101736 / FJAT-27264) TaxID=1850362 RepID=UPI000807DD7C|nr:anthranilate synthase component I family protein [Bacillus sp. FJAT-27264]OBZ15399.1 anthranilate synthase [Bacillus sp. FJAT-27264]
MALEILTTRQWWEQWANEGWSTLPLLIQSQQKSGKLPASWKAAWELASPYSVLLESGKGGRYTYLALAPASVLQGKGDSAEVIDPSAEATDLGSGSSARPGASLLEGKPLEVLQRWMSGYTSPRLPLEGVPPFTGGCLGFLGYDVVRSLERLPSLAEDDPGFPDYLFMRMEEVWIYDHEADMLYCAVHVPLVEKGSPQSDEVERLYNDALSRAERMLAQWGMITSAAGLMDDSAEVAKIYAGATGEWPGMSSAFTNEQFQQAVLDVQEYIRKGDVFQVNLSLRQEAALKSQPEDIYEWLRRLNPSPYMGLLRSPGFALSSASPELLVKLHGDSVSARPIAGTRRRGLTPAEDAAMEAELRGSEKERAEHIMLVDLERNDIGRVAAYGSVHVPELMTVERYSHVMHLVSQVEGTIAPGKDAYDVIAALFPGGTITGAPKVRTMEIIEELEPVRRGPYTGSMGWIDYNGNMELNIIIRTLAVQNGIGYIQTGAGIVIDSDPYREYRECHNKAKAIVTAVLCSEHTQELQASGGAEGGATL